MDAFMLEGDVAVVTGALGKLGPVWVGTLLDAGANVLALDRPGVPPSPAFAALSGRYGAERLVSAGADVCSRPELEAALRRCEEAFGPPGILVNNAGIDRPPSSDGKGRRLEDIPLEENLRILEVNAAGLFLVSQVFGGAMARAGRGSIINIGSGASQLTPANLSVYAATKSALDAITRVLAKELGPRKIRVNSINPGATATEGARAVGLIGTGNDFEKQMIAMTPLGRIGQPSDIAPIAVFLASEDSRWLTGEIILASGGQR